MEPKRILLVDDSAAVTQLFADLLTTQLGCKATTKSHVTDITPEFIAEGKFDLAIIDLSFAHQDQTGIDVLLTVATHSPATKLAILTMGDGWTIDLLRLAWDAFELAGALSKTASVEHQVRVIKTILNDGSAPIDGVLRAVLTGERNLMRSAKHYQRLVKHAGHAKLWSALYAASPQAEYAEIASISGLKLNTVRGYRRELLAELELHGLEGPTMQELQAFGLLVRPLLRPYLRANGISS